MNAASTSSADEVQDLTSNEPKKRTGHCRSNWWQYFEEVSVNGKKMAKCKYCRVRYEKNGTGNIKSHVLNKHREKISGQLELGQSTITTDVTKTVFKASILSIIC